LRGRGVEAERKVVMYCELRGRAMFDGIASAMIGTQKSLCTGSERAVCPHAPFLSEYGGNHFFHNLAFYFFGFFLRSLLLRAREIVVDQHRRSELG
jgi:hypothetical protein